LIVILSTKDSALGFTLNFAIAIMPICFIRHCKKEGKKRRRRFGGGGNYIAKVNSVFIFAVRNSITNMNQLILGDCLEVLKQLNSESVDLVYIDPPFFSNRTYEVIWGDKGEVRSFEDRFSGGIDHYIAWLKERVQELHRILKPTGSIFVHCDWHADSYIRVYILDKIFGTNNFQSHIVWRRTTAHGNAKQGSKKFEINYDTIYHYSKTNKYIWNTIYEPFKDEQIEKQYNKIDDKGRRYRLVTPTAAKGGGDTSYEFYGVKPPQGRYWAYSKAKMEEMKQKGLLYFSSSGQPYIIYYLDERQGVAVMAFWDDIKQMAPTSKERIGYPTQKPERLLERIIQSASNEGDTVLDCFMGGGTTIAVADRLNRNWIGIDQSPQAVKVTEFRLNVQQGKVVGATGNMFAVPFMVKLHKYDYDTLRYKDAFAFEAWIVEQFGGVANAKQRGDLGIDGRTKDNQPIQVKRSDNIGRNVIDNFFSAVQRYDKASFEKNKAEDKPVGVIIAFSFGKGAIQEVARLKNEEHVIIKLVTVEEIVPIAKKPNLKIDIKDLGVVKNGLREVELLAVGESENGIEFYAWQFDYKDVFSPEILFDKSGKQIKGFKAGEHHIAVKVVDNEGLESLEVVKLKINGVVSVVS
jgi:DNA modification methylase